MTLTPGSLAQAASAAILFTSMFMAVRDWGRMTPPQGNDVLRQAARWTRAGVVLVAILVLIQAAAFGPHAAAGFMHDAGWWLLLQAGAALVIIPAGAAWAAQCEGDPLRVQTRAWGAWPWGRLAAALAIMLLWTALTRVLFAPNENPDLAQTFRLNDMPLMLQWPLLIAMITLAPILEETLFRHYLLYRITAALGALEGRSFLKRRSGKAAAIVITSLLWSIGHAGAVDPYWFKLVQIAPMGLILGAVAWKWGLEPAIALHWSFNLALAAWFLLGGG